MQSTQTIEIALGRPTVVKAQEVVKAQDAFAFLLSCLRGWHCPLPTASVRSDPHHNSGPARALGLCPEVTARAEALRFPRGRGGRARLGPGRAPSTQARPAGVSRRPGLPPCRAPSLTLFRPQRRPRCQDNAAPGRRKRQRKSDSLPTPPRARERRKEPKAVGSTRRTSPPRLSPSCGRSGMEGATGTRPARGRQRAAPRLSSGSARSPYAGHRPAPRGLRCVTSERRARSQRFPATAHGPRRSRLWRASSASVPRDASRSLGPCATQRRLACRRCRRKRTQQ